VSADLFDRLATTLEERTELSRLEARGTLRLALKNAGLEPEKLTPSYAEALVKKILPRELESRGVPDVPGVCDAVPRAAQQAGAAADAHRPEALFERLGS